MNFIVAIFSILGVYILLSSIENSLKILDCIFNFI